MVYRAFFVFLILCMRVITAYGMEREEEIPLLPKVSASLTTLPPEINFRIDISLQEIKDAVALQSTSKALHTSSELKMITSFAKQLVKFQKLATANPPFFNEDRHAKLTQLEDKIVKAKKLMEGILTKTKIYGSGGHVPAWATLCHELQSRYLAFELNLKNISHPLHNKIRSLKEHDLLILPSDNQRINDVVTEYGGRYLPETMPMWQRVVHTIGRNKKIMALGTLTLSAACIVGTYYLMQYPAFDEPTFISAYDSTQTGQAYGGFSYNGVDLPWSIVQPNWCMPNGRQLRWEADVRYQSCNENNIYSYLDPDRNPPHANSGRLKIICDKTPLDAATFLYERCGFNVDFWYSLIKPFNDPNHEVSNGGRVYCNLHPSNQSLVCANLMGHRQSAYVNRISEISLTSVADYYNHHYVVRARGYGGFMGSLTFAFLGFIFWSWCLGEI